MRVGERKPYQFNDLEALKKWLETTKWGADVMRDVLYGRHGERFLAEHVTREIVTLTDDQLPARTCYVVVKSFADGWLEVFAERNVQVEIMELPWCRSAKAEAALDGWTDAVLRWPFRQVHWPANRRACQQLTPFMDVREWIERNAEARLTKQTFAALTELSK